jgi:F-type H+-transporting ATPase subunit delta
MRADAVARRYARAIFELADEQGILEAVAGALASTATLLEDERVARVLTGPVPREQKHELLQAIGTNLGGPAVFCDLLLLLADRDRIDHLGAIRDVFDALVDRKRGRARAQVRSAAALAPDLVADLARIFGELTGTQVLPEVTVDPALLAGVIVEVGGRVYDGSLRTQLVKLRQQMANGS